MPLSVDQRAARIRAIVFDVDGVLTRGEIIYGPGGEWKVFDVQDGHGFSLARRAGLKLALLSGRASKALRSRAADLKVDALVEGSADKARGLAAILKKLGIPGEAACYVGDDLVDLSPMRAVGLAVAVANAVPETRRAAAWVTRRRGGEGAAREVIERILKAKGLWKKILADHP